MTEWIDNDPRPWWVSVGDALSQLINAALLKGHPNESVSGRCYRETVLKSNRGAWMFAYDTINSLFFLQENHCKEAYDGDVAMAARLLSYHGRHNEQ